MIKNVLKIVSVLAFSLSLNSYAEAGKNYSSDEDKKCPTKKVCSPLEPKRTPRKYMGRKFRKDGTLSKALARRLVRVLFPEEVENEDLPVQPLQIPTNQHSAIN